MAAFTNNSSYEQIFDHLTGESKYQTLTAEEQTELIDILLQPKPKALKGKVTKKADLPPDFIAYLANYPDLIVQFESLHQKNRYSLEDFEWLMQKINLFSSGSLRIGDYILDKSFNPSQSQLQTYKDPLTGEDISPINYNNDRYVFDPGANNKISIELPPNIPDDKRLSLFYPFLQKMGMPKGMYHLDKGFILEDSFVLTLPNVFNIMEINSNGGTLIYHSPFGAFPPVKRTKIHPNTNTYNRLLPRKGENVDKVV
ncbi:hypothetical protein AGMMS50249_4040 [candidate division SR1 bacterium]|nr:hypothetical protein AGMMS50249_4040 [candidate division SR1 bacterium]